jgi:hypothetical protein
MNRDFGCDYCADTDNRRYGHVTQIGTHAELSLLLLRCPRCRALYEVSGDGSLINRLTTDQAAMRYPALPLDAD